MFSDVDLARAQLIRDLREDFGVMMKASRVSSTIIDQMHWLAAQHAGSARECAATETSRPRMRFLRRGGRSLEWMAAVPQGAVANERVRTACSEMSARRPRIRWV